MSTPTLTPIAVKVADAAEMLGFSDPKTIRALIKSGKLRARKVGRVYLVSVKSLRALIGETD